MGGRGAVVLANLVAAFPARTAVRTPGALVLGRSDRPAGSGSMWAISYLPVDAMTAREAREGRPAAPAGRAVHLATGVSTWVWEVPGPPGAPVVVLLHGWMATAALNWYGSLDYLGRSFRVIAPDIRGHGRLGRGAPPFTLEGCADDIAGLEDALGVGRALVVGYSMGGAIAQVFAKRHRDRAEGLVLCATAACFARRLKLRPVVRAMGRFGSGAVRRWPDAGQRFLSWRIARHDQLAVARRARAERRAGVAGSGRAATAGGEVARNGGPVHPDWALEERSMADLAAFIEAGAALNAYDSSAWLPDLDIPAAALVTQRDKMVAPWRQEAMVGLIRGARRYVVDAGHDAVVSQPEVFLPALRDACTGLIA